MYQIFVVEDELLIRQNIRNMVEKMQGPYAFCGEASDGEMALSMIQELMPDILLTDIRMPFLDGLGLIRHAKALMPWLKVAIISGYGDFEYAQKAISLGVDQYLLKPVRQAELVQAVEAMAAQIEKTKAAGSGMPGGMDEGEVRLALRRQWLEQLLYDRPDLDQLLEKAQALGLDVVKAHYLVTIVSFDSSDADQYQLRNAVQKTMEEAGCGLYRFNSSDQMTYLTCDSDPDLLNERVYQLVTILRHELRDLCPVVTAVIGLRAGRLGAVSEAYHAAAGLMKAVRNLCVGKVINMNDPSPVSPEITRLESPFGEDFQRRLQYAGPEAVPAMIDDILNGRDGDQFESVLVRYNALLSLFKTAACLTPKGPSAAEKAGIDREFDLAAASGSKSAFREAAVGILQRALREQTRRSGETEGYFYVITRAQRYAQEHFRDPDISLLSTARHVGMSAAYFSTVFSQTAGQSFISYLTGLRMDRAKELLTGTDMRLTDIAMEIGYNEPNYFSHVFRKTVGMTPKEYRQRHTGQ